jgi:hypothetical protein
LAVAHDSDAVDDDRGKGFVVGSAFDPRDGGYQQGRVFIAESEDGVLTIELRDRLFGDEELRAVGPTSRRSRSSVGHGEETGLVEGERGVDLVLEEVAGIAGAVAHAVAALDHKGGNDAMKGSAVVERLMMHLLEGLGVCPVLGAFGEADEIRYGDGGFFFEEFTGETAHGGVKDGGGAGGYGRGFELAGSAGSVGKLLSHWSGLRLRGYAEGQNECESTKRHAVFDSNKQAIADTQLEQCGGKIADQFDSASTD